MKRNSPLRTFARFGAKMRVEEAMRTIAEVRKVFPDIVSAYMPSAPENGHAAAPIKRERKTAKGFRYAPGTHWTQKPENRAKLQRLLKKSIESRYGKRR